MTHRLERSIRAVSTVLRMFAPPARRAASAGFAQRRQSVDLFLKSDCDAVGPARVFRDWLLYALPVVEEHQR